MHETFEHTADLGLRVRADDLNKLFAEAGWALCSILVANPNEVRAVEEMPFSIKCNDVEELMHDWLTELLFTFHVYRRLLCKFEVNIYSAGMTAVARGEKIDLQRHELNQEVKAITWHGLKVDHSKAGWIAEVIVDI
jgi:SHS2 domain-containing protein